MQEVFALFCVKMSMYSWNFTQKCVIFQSCLVFSKYLISILPCMMKRLDSHPRSVFKTFSNNFYGIFVKTFKSFQLLTIFTNTYLHSTIPANKNMLKANNRNTRERCYICSKLTMKTPERSQTSDVVLVILLLTLNIFNIFL